MFLQECDSPLPKAQLRVLPTTTPEAVHVPVIGVTQPALLARSRTSLPQVLATQIASFSCRESRHRQYRLTHATPALAVNIGYRRQLMIAVIGCIVCARRSLFLCPPRRHSNRRRHLLGIVAVVVNTAEVASEVIITVDGRLPHYGRALFPGQSACLSDTAGFHPRESSRVPAKK